MRFTLPFVLKNPENGPVGSHWSVRSRKRAADKARCAGYVLSQLGKGTGNVGRRRVVITLHRPPEHALDRGGAYSSVKVIPDVLVGFGHLRDDSDEWCDLQVVQVDSKERKTVVEISEIDSKDPA